MKRLLAFSFALLSGCSFAAFDLQQVSRFNSSALSPTYFHRVISKGNGTTFVVAGYVAEDILLVEYDALGGVIRSAIWDSPLAEIESLPVVRSYTDGRILLGTGRFLVQFSPTLTLNWEVERTASFIPALDGLGNAYAVEPGKVERYNPSGVSLGNLSFTNFLAQDAKAFDGLTEGGLVVAGRDTTLQKSCVIRLSSSLTQLYRLSDPLGPANGSARYLSVDTESDGHVVLSGRRDGATGIFSTITDGGAMFTYAPAGLEPAYGITISGSNDVIVEDSGDLTRLDRSTGAILATQTLSSPSLFARIPGADRIAGIQGTDMRLFNDETLTYLGASSVPAGLNGGATVNSNLAAFVGESQRSGVLALTDGTNGAYETYQFIGSPRRDVLFSRPYGDGSIALGSIEQGAAGPRFNLARYRPNGTLFFARTISTGPATLFSGAGDMFADGAVVMVGAPFSGSTWAFARVNAAGTPTVGKSFIDLQGFVPNHVVANSDGSSSVFGLDPTLRLVHWRVSSIGNLVARTVYDDGQAIEAPGRPLRLASGLIFVANTLDDSRLRLRIVNPGTGVSTNPVDVGTTVPAGFRSTVDGAGNIVLAYVDALELKLERRNPANLNVINTRNAGFNYESVEGLAVGPNGNTVCAVETQADDELRYFGPGGFANVTTSTIASTVLQLQDVAIDSTNFVYLLGSEGIGFTLNTYAARYLANGVRSAQRRTAGAPKGVHIAGGGVWVTGQVGTRKKGRGPYAARYSL